MAAIGQMALVKQLAHALLGVDMFHGIGFRRFGQRDSSIYLILLPRLSKRHSRAFG